MADPELKSSICSSVPIGMSGSAGGTAFSVPSNCSSDSACGLNSNRALGAGTPAQTRTGLGFAHAPGDAWAKRFRGHRDVLLVNSYP